MYKSKVLYVGITRCYIYFALQKKERERQIGMQSEIFNSSLIATS